MNSKLYGSSIGSYPIMTTASWAKAGRMERLRYTLQRHPITIALGYLTIFLYGMCIRSFLVDRRQHFDSALSIGMHGALIALLAVFAPALMLVLLLLPMTVACAVGAYLFYAQHNYPKARVMEGKDWTEKVIYRRPGRDEEVRHFHAIVDGGDGAKADFVLMNAAASLFVAGKVSGFREGVDLARESIASGRAREVLDHYVALTREVAGG